MDNIKEIFNNILPSKQVLTNIEDRVAYASDASLLEGLPSCILLIYNQDDFNKAVKLCVENNLKFLVRGKATGYTGGCVPQENCVVISLENWKGVIEFDEVKETAIFAPGTTISEINDFAEKYNLFFPPDPISKDHCTLGGAISENSSGPRCLRFGPLHCFIEEFQFYTIDGKEHIIKKDDYSEPSDYFYSIIGSEGTLGAVGWIKVRLVKKPTETLLFCMEFSTSSIINKLLEKCFLSGIPFSAMEMITPSYHTKNGRVGKYYLLLEYFSYTERDKKDFYAKLINYTKDLDVEVTMPSGTIYEVRGKAYQTNRKLINDLIKMRPISLLVDGVVPRTKLQELVEGLFDIAQVNNVPMLDTFHFSDGNIHPTFFFENTVDGTIEKHKILGLVMQKCIELGGSLAAEHGIGLEKIDYIKEKHNNFEIKEFYRIKNLFDKNHHINPGKVLPNKIPNSVVINNKFESEKKILIDKINMNILVDANVKLSEINDICNSEGLNIGYRTITSNPETTIIQEIRKCNKNLLSKRHGELKDSILGIKFEENGEQIIFGDKLVKNVSGYNICRSNSVLQKNVNKICLRVFNNNDNKLYEAKINGFNKKDLLLINSVSHDFTPIIHKKNNETTIIFSSIYNLEELSNKGINNIKEVDFSIFKNIKILKTKKQLLNELSNIEKDYYYNYQKGEIYYYEY